MATQFLVCMNAQDTELHLFAAKHVGMLRSRKQGAALFFAVTLLASFFIIIVAINQMEIPADMAPNFFMLGLVPPSIATILLFTKVLGRLL